ncbi:restriction endonuclease subunit S [Luteimonas sp. e5]
MSFARYPAYKDSGVEWLGEVPEHWDVAAGRRVYRQVREQAHAGDVQLSATQKYGVIPQSEFMEAEDQKVMLALKGLDNFKHVEKNDFVISLRSFQGGIEHSAYSGCVSPAYTVLRAQQEIDPSYMAFALKSSSYISALQSATDGIRDGKNISYDQFGSIGLPLPPVPEQTAIANFLDRKTARIDALVAEQQRLIALLKEKRQAVISHAVTKGLNPDASMKDSGVEWLGEVPAHWEVSAIKYVASVGNGSTPNKATLKYWTDGDFPWLTSSVVNLDKVLSADYFVTRTALEECHLPVLQPPVVLIGITGEGRTRGMAATLGIQATINQHIAYVKPDAERVRVEFLRLFFDMAYERMRFDSEGAGSTKGAITCQQISNMRLPLPPSVEQEKIGEYVHDTISRFSELEEEMLQTLTFLQERRAALISAAVTGQIDVRGLVAREIA